MLASPDGTLIGEGEKSESFFSNAASGSSSNMAMLGGIAVQFRDARGISSGFGKDSNLCARWLLRPSTEHLKINTESFTI